MEAHAFGAWSLLPPILAIALAVLTRRVVVSLAAGVFVGALVFAGGHPLDAAASTVQELLWPSFIAPDHLQVFAFTLLMGAMVGVVHRSGGMHGIVDKLAPLARSRRGGQLVTWLLGLVVFFDDYANTLLLGTTMQPLADRLKISREKLAYVVDSTAAPVAGLALVSTWVAGEISAIQAGLEDASLTGASAFSIFVGTIPYRFYVLWALVFVPLVAWFRRDFGPMLAAELRAAGDELPGPTAGTANAVGNAPMQESIASHHWMLAVGPIGVTVVVVVRHILLTGSLAVRDGALQASWINVVGNGDSYGALVYGSAAGLLVAISVSWMSGVLSARAVASAVLRGARWMLPAMGILWFAWSLSLVCSDEFVGTGVYLGGFIERVVAPAWLPTLVFIIASAVAFATGTSWGTMAILMPLVIRSTCEVLSANSGAAVVDHPVFLASTGSVLAGAILGDHCSPISDTTILSSMASGCRHLAHVWTQLPYALIVAGVAILFGTLPVGLGINVWILVPLGPLVLAGCLLLLGRRVP